MVLFGKRNGRVRLLLAAGLLLCGGRACGAADLEVDRWFARHPETLWRPFVEKWGVSKAAMTSPVENLTLPLDYYSNGRVRAVLHAQKAQMLLEGMIFAEGVRVDMLAEDGRPDGRLTAEGCLFNRTTKQGYCEGAVSVEKSGDRLKGRGMYFSMEQQFIKILAECEIRTQRIQLNFGRL
jgi:hypothetical protein